MEWYSLKCKSDSTPKECVYWGVCDLEGADIYKCYTHCVLLQICQINCFVGLLIVRFHHLVLYRRLTYNCFSLRMGKNGQFTWLRISLTDTGECLALSQSIGVFLFSSCCLCCPDTTHIQTHGPYPPVCNFIPVALSHCNQKPKLSWTNTCLSILN